MKDNLTILGITIFFGSFFTYKVIRGIWSYLDFKYGKVMKAKVVKMEWIDAPLMKFSYLYPKKQLKIVFHFSMNNDLYEKEDVDIHFRYKKGINNSIPKEGDMIDVYVPRSNNPNKVTFNKYESTLRTIIGFAVLAFISFSITALVLYNL